MCEKPSEPHSSVDVNPTITTQTKVGKEGLFSMDLENFPMSIIEVMLFKLEDSGEKSAAKNKLLKMLSDTHSIKTNAVKSWRTDLKLVRMETVSSRYFLFDPEDRLV